MSTREWRGFAGFLELLEEQVQLRGTGEVAAAAGSIFLVFGHALHAQSAGMSGLSAVEAIGALLRDQPEVAVDWHPGRTAGNTQTLAPSDPVAQALRGTPVGGAPAGHGHDDQDWARVVADACQLLDASLHRHATSVTEHLRNASLDEAGLLAAVEAVRRSPPRAVAPATLASALDQVDALVRAHGRTAARPPLD